MVNQKTGRGILCISLLALFFFSGCPDLQNSSLPDPDPDPSGYTISVAANISNGTITVSQTSAEAETTITVTVKPLTGYRLQAGSLKVNNGSVSINGSGPTYTFTMPEADVTVTAVFEALPPGYYNISVSKTGEGEISVADSAQSGDTVTVTVTPATGWQLQAGSLKYNGTGISGPPYTFTMPAAIVAVTGVFEKIPYTVTKGTISGEGDISFSGGPAYYYGDTVTVTVSPESRNKLAGGGLKWNGTSITVNGTVGTFTMPAENVTITAEFEPFAANEYYISAPSVPGGSISVPPGGTGIANTTITITVTPGPGRQLQAGSLKVNDGSVSISGSGPTYTFTMPEDDVTVTAVFEKVPYTVTKITSPTLYNY